MEKNLSEFLSLYQKGLKDLPTKFDIEQLSKAVGRRKLPYFRPFHYLEDERVDLPWLPHFKEATSAIMTIVGNPRNHLMVLKDVKKAEQAAKIDTQDIQDTIKNSAFWKKDPVKKKTPFKVYSAFYEIEYAIYENRFIVHLIDKMLSYLAAACDDLMHKVRYIGKNFIHYSANYGDALTIEKISKYEKKDIRDWEFESKIPLLTSNDAYYLDTLKELMLLRKELNHLCFTSFYKVVKKARALNDSDVVPTNLLVGDHNYFTCYNFFKYLRKLEASKPPREEIDRSTYMDYVFSAVCYSLNKIGFKMIKSKDKLTLSPSYHIITNNTKLIKDNITCQIEMASKEIHLTFEDHNEYLEASYFEKRKQNHICLIINPMNKGNMSFDDLDHYYERLVVDRCNETGFQSAFVVTPFDESSRDDVILVSPYLTKVDQTLEKALRSSLIYAPGDEDIYSAICPVCGSKIDGIQEDGSCHCPACQSAYTFLTTPKGKTYVWFKRIKEKE